MPCHSQITQSVLQHLPRLRRQQALHRPTTQADDIDAETVMGQVIGKLATNQAIPKDRDASYACQTLTEPVVILQVIDADQRRTIALDRQANRLRAAGKHQLAVFHFTEAGTQAPCRTVDTQHLAVRIHADVQALLDCQR
ncbi:hypothetical protein D3C84_687280 [compost metagenome]